MSYTAKVVNCLDLWEEVNKIKTERNQVIVDLGKSSVIEAGGLSSDWEVRNKRAGYKLLFQES